MEFAARLKALQGAEAGLVQRQALSAEVIALENERRGLFARHREDWEVPEVAENPHLGLVDVYAHLEAFRCLSESVATGTEAEGNKLPVCFPLGEKRIPAGSHSTVESIAEFETSFDCFTESQLRFLNWDNIVAAGGSVAACLAPLAPCVEEARTKSWAEGRCRRRTFFHDEAYPGSDVDLFMYGLSAEAAEKKLEEVFESVQAANPFEVICFRSANAGKSGGPKLTRAQRAHAS